MRLYAFSRLAVSKVATILWDDWVVSSEIFTGERHECGSKGKRGMAVEIPCSSDFVSRESVGKDSALSLRLINLQLSSGTNLHNGKMPVLSDHPSQYICYPKTPITHAKMSGSPKEISAKFHGTTANNTSLASRIQHGECRAYRWHGRYSCFTRTRRDHGC